MNKNQTSIYATHVNTFLGGGMGGQVIFVRCSFTHLKTQTLKTNKSAACGTNAHLSVKKWHNSKTTAFRVKPLFLPLHLVMMSKYSKFGSDTSSIFE